MQAIGRFFTAATGALLDTHGTQLLSPVDKTGKTARRSLGEPPERGRAAFATFTMLILLSAILLATMPRTIYSGDAVAIRQATVNWLNHGEISVAHEIAGVYGSKSKYFFENPNTGKWYPKFGILNTFLYAPPLLVERWMTGELDYTTSLGHEQLRQRCRLLNFYNIFVCLVVARYLLRITRLYCRTAWSSVIYVMFVFFGTFFWNYSRAQTGELFQVLFFCGLYYHLMLYRRECLRESMGAAQPTQLRRARMRHLAAAMLLVGLLVLQKLVFAVLLPIVIAFVMYAGYQPSKWGSVLEYGRAIFSKGRRDWLAVCLASLTVISTLVLVANTYRFGSPWATGYGQWEREREFLSGNPLDGLWGYLLNPQKSIFLYFPILALAVLGVRTFYRRSPFGLLFALCSFLSVYGISSMFINWSGNWCYGPRYLLFVLPVLALPTLNVLDWALLHRRELAARLAMCGIALLFCWSASRQWYVNRLDYFSPFHVASEFRDLESPVVQDYLSKPLWIINRDLLAHQSGSRMFPVLQRSQDLLSPQEFHQKSERLTNMIVGNMYFLDVEPLTPTMLPGDNLRMAGTADAVDNTPDTQP